MGSEAAEINETTTKVTASTRETRHSMIGGDQAGVTREQAHSVLGGDQSVVDSFVAKDARHSMVGGDKGSYSPKARS